MKPRDDLPGLLISSGAIQAYRLPWWRRIARALRYRRLEQINPTRPPMTEADFDAAMDATRNRMPPPAARLSLAATPPPIPAPAAESRDGCPGDDTPAEVFAASSMRHFSLTSLYLRIGLWPLALVVCGGLCVAAWRNFF